MTAELWRQSPLERRNVWVTRVVRRRAAEPRKTGVLHKGAESDLFGFVPTDETAAPANKPEDGAVAVAGPGPNVNRAQPSDARLR